MSQAPGISLSELENASAAPSAAGPVGPVIRYPADLPITAQRERILAALRENQVVVIAGETGSGKTTQLPKMCLEAGLAKRGRVGCTQPRRVAAMSISKRVAEELRVTWGREVGCKMRFNDDTSRETVLKFMTDGILLAEIQSDPLLRSYSAIIIDEAHERSLNIDFLLGYLKGVLAKRRDLKLIITSATIDTRAFSEAFGNAPIIEVSGRLYPVEIRYAPLETFTSLEYEGDYLGAAAKAAENALIESDDGDVLVFLPTERDIREAMELLEGRLGRGIEVLGLYGRMASADQQRVFSRSGRRRVIVATNIAETSLTIPGIRYVIDSGLARVSRYAPRARTKRLPVEPVAQSSANQRAGRAGRVRDGVCVRLYSEEDFLKRPLFAQPEIQRSNLAEVILRMMAFRLGNIEDFPFLNPPPPAAIRAGYELLRELGALDDTHSLTPLGRELARLPLDPTLGRMLVQAREEDVLPEMLVIAAGLSVPDPRERPEDAKEAAAAAHRAFAHAESDFLSLIMIWQAAREANAWQSRNALRRFAKKNFLSVTRLREWRDIHAQLAEAMGARDLPDVTLPEGKMADGVHRAILAASLSLVAKREGRNVYKAAGNREVTLFPGSHLYERKPKRSAAEPRGDRAKNAEAEEKSRQPRWIVAAEFVQTSQLFARTAAGVDPAWIPQLGAHLCEFRYSDPQWDEKQGRVLATERVLLRGLEVRRGRVDYGKINAAAATEIFIREALLEEDSPVTQSFHKANLRLKHKAEAMLARAGRVPSGAVEEALFTFYRERLAGVSSLHDLNRLVKEKYAKEPDFLFVREEELTKGIDTEQHAALFPDEVKLGNTVLPLHYVYNPGGERDGVTIQVPLTVAPHLTTGQIQWLVPGMRREIAGVLLRSLPKSLRRALQPMEEKIADVVENFQPGAGDFLTALAAYLTRRFQIEIKPEDWPPDGLPPYLRPRLEVVDEKKQTVIAGRDLETIRAEAGKRGVDSSAWTREAGKWARPDVRAWDFGDLPDSVFVENAGGVEVRGYPGLTRRGDIVCLGLFRTREEAEATAGAAVRRLAELALSREIAILRKELRGLNPPAPSSKRSAGNFMDALNELSGKLRKDSGLAEPTGVELQESAVTHVLNHLLRLEPLRPLTRARFEAMLAHARANLIPAARKVEELTRRVLALRREVLESPKRHATLEADVIRLTPPDFLAVTPHSRLPHLPRYLKALLVRGERAHLHPAKDAEKAKALLPFHDWARRTPFDRREEVRWLLEEFRVSIFAPELGTAVPVSAKRIEALMEP